MVWLLFLSQLPAHPSSLRVNIWRKMQSAGALGLQNGVWVLPDQPEQVKFLQDLLDAIQKQEAKGASGQIFTVNPLGEAVEQDVIARFRAARDEEYAEFDERSREFLAEINKETQKQKFTFAELEENEQDLQRLKTWLENIRKRDFFGGNKAHEAMQIYEACRTALKAFTTEVYNRQTAEPSEPLKPSQGSNSDPS